MSDLMMNNLVVLKDLEQLKEVMEDEFGMLTEMFADDSKTLVDTIITSALTKESEALRIAAHTLKGSSSNMCATSMSLICEKIELKAKEADFDGIDNLVVELKTIQPKVVEILKSVYTQDL